jgi:hypothetical protein
MCHNTPFHHSLLLFLPFLFLCIASAFQYIRVIFFALHYTSLYFVPKQSVPTILDAYDTFIKQIGNNNISYNNSCSSTCWGLDEKLRLIKNQSNYADICRGIYCDRQQCCNACIKFRISKLDKKSKEIKNIYKPSKTY